jgi:IS30 family transposase
MLGRSGSALSREYKRNLNDNGNYLPSEAEHQAKRRKKWAAETGSKCEPYEDNIYSRLCEGWTPEQMAETSLFVSFCAVIWRQEAA